MEELLRGYVYAGVAQSSYYFAGNVENIANFIYANATDSNEVVVENIFGHMLVKVSDGGNNFEGSSHYLEKVKLLLNDLSTGKVNKSPIEYLDLSNLDSRDEFDSREITEKELVRLYDGH